jgi:hypothetical protein
MIKYEENRTESPAVRTANNGWYKNSKTRIALRIVRKKRYWPTKKEM